jgi:beta-glucosidase
MTIEEKAGTMFVSMIGMTGKGTPYDKPKLSTDPFDLLLAIMVPPASDLLVKKKLNSFNILNS